MHCDQGPCRVLLRNRVRIILIACIRSIAILFGLIDTLGHLDQKCCRILFVPTTTEKMTAFSRPIAHNWAALVFNALLISTFWKIRRTYRKTCQRWCPFRLRTPLINLSDEYRVSFLLPHGKIPMNIQFTWLNMNLWMIDRRSEKDFLTKKNKRIEWLREEIQSVTELDNRRRGRCGGWGLKNEKHRLRKDLERRNEHQSTLEQSPFSSMRIVRQRRRNLT